MRSHLFANLIVFLCFFSSQLYHTYLKPLFLHPQKNNIMDHFRVNAFNLKQIHALTSPVRKSETTPIRLHDTSKITTVDKKTGSAVNWVDLWLIRLHRPVSGIELTRRGRSAAPQEWSHVEKFSPKYRRLISSPFAKELPVKFVWPLFPAGDEDLERHVRIHSRSRKEISARHFHVQKISGVALSVPIGYQWSLGRSDL